MLITTATATDLDRGAVHDPRQCFSAAQTVQRLAYPGNHSHLLRQKVLLDLVPVRVQLDQQLLDARHTHSPARPRGKRRHRGNTRLLDHPQRDMQITVADAGQIVVENADRVQYGLRRLQRLDDPTPVRHSTRRSALRPLARDFEDAHHVSSPAPMKIGSLPVLRLPNHRRMRCRCRGVDELADHNLAACRLW
jgi:hypothetical protein